MSRPRVFILGKLPPPYYGPAVATQILLNSRLQEYFDLTHIDTKINQQLNSMGRFSFWKPVKGIQIYLSYVFKIIQKKPHLILIPQGQTTSAFLKDSIFIIIGRLRGSKVLLQLRGSDWLNWLNNSGKLIQWYVRQNLKLVSGVIVLGDKLRYLFEGYLTPERIFVVPNGANFLLSKRSDKRNDQLSVLFFSNLFRSKGVEDVIDSAILLKGKTSLSFRFLLTGIWNDEKVRIECISKIDSGFLPLQIFPPASGKEKLKFFEEADIFVFPPRDPEGHPWVIVEAMAAGLPIITTDRGAITESVIHGVNGFIVEANNPMQIAEKLEYLMNHPDVRETMGKESKRLYEENFTEEKMIEKLTNVFNTVLSMP